MRLIDADKALKWVDTQDFGENAKVMLRSAINIMPTVDAEPRARGWWRTENGFDYCSMCGGQRPENSGNYCPNCGSEMHEVGEGLEKILKEELK